MSSSTLMSILFFRLTRICSFFRLLFSCAVKKKPYTFASWLLITSKDPAQNTLTLCLLNQSTPGKAVVVIRMSPKKGMKPFYSFVLLIFGAILRMSVLFSQQISSLQEFPASSAVSNVKYINTDKNHSRSLINKYKWMVRVCLYVKLNWTPRRNALSKYERVSHFMYNMHDFNLNKRIKPYHHIYVTISMRLTFYAQRSVQSFSAQTNVIRLQCRNEIIGAHKRRGNEFDFDQISTVQL